MIPGSFVSAAKGFAWAANLQGDGTYETVLVIPEGDDPEYSLNGGQPSYKHNVKAGTENGEFDAHA